MQAPQGQQQAPAQPKKPIAMPQMVRRSFLTSLCRSEQKRLSARAALVNGGSRMTALFLCHIRSASAGPRRRLHALRIETHCLVDVLA